MGNKTSDSSGNREDQNGTCEAWGIGWNRCGQQLNGTTKDVMELQPIQNVKNKQIKTIESMRESTFVRYEDGELGVGGSNTLGTLGVGSYDDITTLKHLEFKVKNISKGIAAPHVFIQKEDDTLVCAGWNSKKQCGVETGSDKHNVWMRGPQIPIKIQTIATGFEFTVFLGHNGIMFGCGDSTKGALGMGEKMTQVSTPTMIPTKIKMKDVVAGWDHCVALSQEGHAVGWGSGGGRCGHGEMDVYVPTPIDALQETKIQSVSCGAYHSMFLSSSGGVFATGSNSYGECGDGTTTDIDHPKQITIGNNNTEYVKSVQCGALHTIVTTKTGKVFIWGSNRYNQCLILDDKVKKVLTPTQYTIPKKWNAQHKMVQVIPGYMETWIVIFDTIASGWFLAHIHPKEWNEHQVAAWLCCLEDGKYADYKDAFIENQVDGEELGVLDENELKDPRYGVTKISHRRGIAQKMQHLLRTWNKNDDEDDECEDSKEEMKTESDHDTTDYNTDIYSNKPVTRVDNGVAMFFGVAKYLHKSYKNLDDIDDDERHFRKTFAIKFGYRFISNQYKEKTWTKEEALDWIVSKRDEILLQNGRVQYNGLIFCSASHGSMHSIICSDGTPLEVALIRSIFASTVKPQFRYLPKIFIFNCCRTPYAKEARGPSESTGAAGYGMTITGREGNPVFGATLSSFVADAFGKGNKQKLYDIYRSAKAKAQHTMGLTLQEHDTDVDDVVFMKRVSRGSELSAQVDGTGQYRDDALQNILEPRGGSIDLSEYLNALRDAGFTNKKMIRTLTSDKLQENKIKMKVFHKKELLKRIADLQQ